MTSENLGQLLFIDPEEPEKSFKWTFDKLASEKQKLEDIFKGMKNEKKCYFEFVDNFERKIKPQYSVEEQRIFQPFYIKMMVPMACNISIKLPSGEKLCLKVDPMDTFAKIMERIEKEKGYPEDQQKICLKGKILNNDQRLIDYNLHKSNESLDLQLKSVLHIRAKNEMFDVYTDLTNPVMFVHFLIEKKNQDTRNSTIVVFSRSRVRY